MKKNLTELVFILDKSGSMCGLEADTIGGFNSLIAKQKKEDGQVLVSTVLFDDDSEVIHDRVDINEIQPMTDEQYCVGGCTALLDAIGGAIKHIKNVHKYAREEDKPEKTLFIITTDGCENASKTFTYKKVKKLVEEQQKKSEWEFLFLGANIDAIEVAGQFGISSSRAVNYKCDKKGTEVNFQALENTITKFRNASKKCASKMLDEGSWKESIEQDYAERI